MEIARYLFYGGTGINVVGDLLLAGFAIKYYFAFRRAKKMPIRLDELRGEWLRKRRIAFGLIIGGAILSLAATMIP